MDCVIICDRGFEDIFAKQLTSRYGISCNSIAQTSILFSLPDESYVKTLAEIAYTFQGAIKILSHVKQFSVSTYDETCKNISGVITTDYEKEISTISTNPLRISCVRKGEHDFKSTDVTSYISRNHFSKKDYKSYVTFLTYIFENHGFCGIDFAGRDLHKRDYKIFIGAQTMRSTVAFGMILFSEATKDMTVLDPFMGSGTIPIEAGLYFSKKSPFFYSKEKCLFQRIFPSDWESFFLKIDSLFIEEKLSFYGFDSLLKFLKNSQKNAKIAGINKQIQLSKVDVDWLDTKVEPETIDAIITQPPLLSENGSVTKILKVYKDFFKIAQLLLKKDGTVTILTSHKSFEKLDEFAKEYSFILEKEQIVFEGLEELVLARYRK